MEFPRLKLAVFVLVITSYSDLCGFGLDVVGSIPAWTTSCRNRGGNRFLHNPTNPSTIFVNVLHHFGSVIFRVFFGHFQNVPRAIFRWIFVFFVVIRFRSVIVFFHRFLVFFDRVFRLFVWFKQPYVFLSVVWGFFIVIGNLYPCFFFRLAS